MKSVEYKISLRNISLNGIIMLHTIVLIFIKVILKIPTSWDYRFWEQQYSEISLGNYERIYSKSYLGYYKM